jgi:hypothetical protein
MSRAFSVRESGDFAVQLLEKQESCDPLRKLDVQDECTAFYAFNSIVYAYQI